MSWFSCEFVNVVYYRLSEALILAKGERALWRDEIPRMFAKQSSKNSYKYTYTHAIIWYGCFVAYIYTQVQE